MHRSERENTSRNCSLLLYSVVSITVYLETIFHIMLVTNSVKTTRQPKQSNCHAALMMTHPRSDAQTEPQKTPKPPRTVLRWASHEHKEKFTEATHAMDTIIHIINPSMLCRNIPTFQSFKD